jgi:hypothetical protein
MTNLMQQLQAWAGEGRYDWENGTFNFKGTVRFHPYLSMDEDQQKKYQTLDWKALVQLVLDGTIQVWRPVEHYKPKDDERVLLFDPTHTDEYGEPLTTVIGYYREEDGEFHRFEIYRNAMSLMSPTHYQPLPRLEKGN